MPTVRFTGHLRRYFPDLQELSLSGASVAEVVQGLELLHPGLRSYLLDDQGGLRKHVNIFVDQRQVADRRGLSDAVSGESEVFIVQALSGG